MGKILQKCKVIVWDECTMIHKKSLEALDRSLQDLRENVRPFGNALILLAGDFRRTLPVISRSTPADEINACLKYSTLWRHVHILQLTTNMRVQLQNDRSAEVFSRQLLDIGNGQLSIDETRQISLPDNFYNLVTSKEELISKVFPNIQINYRNHNWLSERAVLAAKNKDVYQLNHFIQSSIQRMPPHILKLKIGVPVMLRNVNQPKLCNGTRLAVEKLMNIVVEATILTGPFKGDVLIPRIPMIPTDTPFKFKRLQFPIRLAFAITINKAQSQSLELCGLHLSVDCFSHGQLYVACSRVGKPDRLYIYANNGKKIDLYNLASELRVSVTLEDKIIDLREKITSCTFFQNNEQFVKEMLDNIVDERKSLEIEALKKIEREDKFLADQRAFELEKLKLQAQNPPASVGNSSQMDSNPMRMDLKTVLPTFIPDKDDISLFLTLFERQMKLLNVPADFWVSHLLESCQVILAETGSFHVERFLFELRTFFEGWLKELDIDSFETLKDLIIADQIKKRCPPDYKNHFLDTWEILNDPVVLAEKLDSYENVKPSSQKLTKLSNSRFSRNTGNPEFRKSHSFRVEKNVSGNHNSAFANPSYIPARNTNTGFHPPISCYGYGNPGIIKSKCPKCSQKRECLCQRHTHVYLSYLSSSST
ncbi:ATP-dependent DNA helicase [Trichonephila clavipes]|nr:ATP-dependent DNA helicase [Trichonephila clavipes]